jgi:hypothetical protein
MAFQLPEPRKFRERKNLKLRSQKFIICGIFRLGEQGAGADDSIIEQ